MDPRMTPVRKSLFQRGRISSTKRRKNSFSPHTEDDSRDDSRDSREIMSLKSANKKKDGHLKVLQERFTHMQKGLGSIDEERSQLVEKAKLLDKEKKVIQKQLELREREILALIKRCASQEEKMRESSKLRATNRDLNKHLDLMASKLRVIEEQTDDRENLKKLLQDSELEREQLKDQLARIQREHDAIADTLQDCLGNIRQLTEEKNKIEEERREDRKRAEDELEKQQVAHINDSGILKQNIQEQQQRIEQMENILQDKIKSNTDLRREKAILSQGKQAEIKEVVEKYERQLQELRDEIEETVGSGNQFYKTKNLEEVSLMKEKLKSKDEQIQELEKGFSNQMEMLMSKQSCLDEAEEDRRNLELKVQAANQLEIKHAALLDFVEILDSNLADLTTANAHLELEKDELREEAEQLRKKAEMLQRQYTSLQTNQKAKESDFRELLNTENAEMRQDLEESLRKSKSEIASLEAELESRNQRIAAIENDLMQAQKLISDKEDEIIRIMEKMEGLRSSLGADLRRARLQAAQFEAEVFAKNQTLASLEGQLEGAKAVQKLSSASDSESQIQSEKSQTEGHLPESETESLRERLQSTENDSKQIRNELERTIQEVRNEAMFLQKKIVLLTEEKATIEEEVEKSRSLINDRDEQIVQVQHMILKHKKRALDLERKLQDTSKELESHREKLNALEAKKDIEASTNAHEELEDRIRILERELCEAKASRSESMANLSEAQNQIEKLEKQLIGEDEYTVSLKNQLQNIANDLLEKQLNAKNLENEHRSATLLQTEQESYNEEKKSKIAELERELGKVKQQFNDLDSQMQQAKEENEDKDKIISSLKDDLLKGQHETKELRFEIQIKHTELEKLEVIVCEEKRKFDEEIKTTNAALKTKEQKITDLEKTFLINDENVKDLQDALSKAKTEIARLEDQIKCEKDARTILEETLRQSNVPTITAAGSEFLPSSDTTDLKKKIQGLLTRQADLTTELDKTNADFESERKSWITTEQNYYKELSICKAKLLVLQNVMIERETVLSSMKKNESQYLEKEKRLLEQENVISDLKEEVQSKTRKLDDLERQFVLKKEDGVQDGVQYAFVESDKRRLEIEDELTSAHDDIRKLTANASTNKQRIDDLELAMKEKSAEIAQKNKNISKSERKCRVLEEKVQSLNEELQREGEQSQKLKQELKSIKTELEANEKTIRQLNASTLSLKESADKAQDKIKQKNDTMATLSESADNAKLDLEKAKGNVLSKEAKIKELEIALLAEKESRLKLEGEIEATREFVSESQKVKEELSKELEEKKQGDSNLEAELVNARKALEALKISSSERIASLENQVSKISTDLTRKDIEIRDLHFQELASKKDDYDKQLEKDTAPLRKEIESLHSSKLEFESIQEQLVDQLSQRDAAIQELKAALLESEVAKKEILNQCDGLKKIELEARDEIEDMKVEHEEALARERELTNTKLRNKDSLHKEELDIAHSELETTVTKLLNSERQLAERSCRLSELIDQNRDFESQLEKERTKIRIVEHKFVKEQSSLKSMTSDLKKVQSDLRRKESIFESKLKEERSQKEYVEESLRRANTKYREAMKTRRNVTDLERENGELKDKIRRQELYLQRKLDKEKMDRVRLTPASPSSRVPRTPTRRTPAQKTANSPRNVSRSSSFSRSRLEAPSSIARGVSTTMSSIPKGRPKPSPAAASYRSTKTARSVFSRSTQIQTPSRRDSTLSAQDILQSELADDRSTSSELSSLLGSPKSKGGDGDDLELEPLE